MNTKILTAFIIAAGPVVGTITGLSLRSSSLPLPIPEPKSITTSSVILAGTDPTYIGDKSAVATLVEFADYQCPACYLANAQAEEMVRSHPKRLRLVFRNFPLPQHSYARSAAVVAERARLQSPERFWKVHDLLFACKADISDQKIDQIAHSANVWTGVAALAAANHAIDEDMKAASTLHIEGTPTFFLSLRNGKAYALMSLAQVESLIPAR